MASKRCPLCRKLSESHAVRCGCGYQYGQDIEETFRLLEQQSRKGIGTAIAGMFLVLVGTGLVAIMLAAQQGGRIVYFSVVGWLSGFGMLARGLGMTTRSRTSKRELEKQRELPAMRVVAK